MRTDLGDAAGSRDSAAGSGSPRPQSAPKLSQLRRVIFVVAILSKVRGHVSYLFYFRTYVTYPILAHVNNNGIRYGLPILLL